MLPAVLFWGGCSDQKRSGDLPVWSSYRDIPGVTGEEITAIEAVMREAGQFTYGMLPSTEAFLNANGELRGYSALFCEWLSELFGIQFVPAHYTWVGLREGLESGSVDFAGDLTPNEERRKIYHMTDPIAQRSLKYYRIAGSAPFAEINKTRLPRYVLQEKTTIAADVLSYAGGTFEPVYALENDEAYKILKAGDADAFINEGVYEAFFDSYAEDVVTSDFFPMLYSPVSFSTQNPKLAPFISVVQKALTNGGADYLNELYDQGYQEYLRHKFFTRLTAEEIEYISKNPVIPFSAEYDNYPVSFFSTHYKKWQGISFDVLKEIEAHTGLRFEVVNSEKTEFPELLKMLESGKVYIHSEVIPSPEREGRFLWPKNSFMTERSVLLSKIDRRNINVNRVYTQKVGLSKGTAHTEFFLKWFPNHPNTVIYESQVNAFDALKNGEVDMVMNSYSTLLYLTNYMELADFKANIVFDNSFESTFGINKDQALLCSIIDKALELIDTRTIAEQWRHRTYDYRLKVVRARMPWLIGSIVLSLCVMILTAVLFVRSRRESKRLEELVTDRTRELALQSATITALFDNIPAHIFAKDLDLQYTQCNKSLLKHFGIQKEDIIGKGDVEGLKVPVELAEKFRAIDRKVINEVQGVTVEERVLGIDGSNSIYEITKTPLMLAGSVIGVLGISYDINDRKEMERKLASTYEYAKKLSGVLTKITKSPTISAGFIKEAANTITKEGCKAINTHCVGIWKFNRDSKVFENVSYYNASTGENGIQGDYDLSRGPEYVKLLKSERLIVMNNPEDCRQVSTAFGGDYGSLCAALDAPIRVDGKMVGVVCVEQRRCDEFPEKREWIIEEQNFVSSLADLMALAISGWERRKARDTAETASKTKSTFLANMSHEIRTPMNAILGITEILIQNRQLPKEAEEGVDKIYNSCNLLLGIINDILDFSKIEAGKLDIIPAQYSVASLINDAVQLNIMRIDSKPIEFKLQVDENIPSKLIGDELRIKQIFNNLLSNAFKYTDSGKVTLTVKSILVEADGNLSVDTQDKSTRDDNHSSVRPSSSGVKLVLSVADTGCGMNKEQLDRLFEEYSRFNQKATASGTGLGLAITRRLVNIMDGEIQVESEQGKGSLFTVLLPQKTVDNEILGADVVANLSQFRINYMARNKMSHQIIRDPMPYGSVLVVDDVETNLYVAAGLMKPYRLQIDTVMSGYEAVDRIKNGKVYDVVFMDHMMPEMDGMMTTKYLRTIGYEAPIVALTANAVAGQADIFLQNGFDDFISKPIDIRQLNSVLNKLIRDKQPPEVIEAARRSCKDAMPGVSAMNPQTDTLLLESFVRDAHKVVSMLEEQNQKTDWLETEENLRTFTIMVHGIKSSLRNIGEAELSELAYKLEIAGRERNIDVITASVPLFLSELCALIKKVEPKQNEYGADDDIEGLRGKLLAIKEMCTEYNRKGALDLLAGITNCSKETKKVLDNIKDYVLHSGFDEAECAAAAYAEELSLVNKNNHTVNPAGSKFQNREIAGLDIAKGLEQYEGDEETYLKVLRSYAADIRSMLSLMDVTGGAEFDGDGYQRAAHSIKGMSRSIFAGQIGEDAAMLEKAAQESDFSYIDKHNSAFLAVVRKLVSQLDDMIAGIDAENPKPKKDKPDAELLVKLSSACKAYSMDGVDAAMEEIEKYEYTSDDGLAVWLRENIDRMAFMQIAEKLSDLEY